MRNKEITIKNQKRIKEYCKELAKLTNKAKFSEGMKKYFDTMSKFHNYSVNNQILILSQNPNASRVAGFHTWKNEFNRHVKKGSHAIWIFAPRTYTETEEILTGNGIKEQEIKHIYFVSVPVFDVSQTQGDPLPHIDYGTNTNNHSDLLIKFEKLCLKENVKLDYKPLRDGLNGYNHKGTIVLNSNNSDDDKLKTGFHEYAHDNLHWNEDKGKYTTKQKETEAEATAFIVCRFLGIETKAYNYLALYNSDGKLILKSMERISVVVNKILTHYKGKTTRQEQTKDKEVIEIIHNY